MISVSGVSKHFGPQVLFRGVGLQLNTGSRYGLVGANGSGKTTFLKMLAGQEPSDEGDITRAKDVRLGVLRQDQFAHDDERIVDVAMRGDTEVFSALAEQDRLSRSAEPDAQRLIELNDIVAHNDGYSLESRAREILVGLGISSASVEAPLRTLSGGFKLRVLLAQVLLSRPNVILLDEPTNHLDILSIRWLETFLQGYTGCAVVISHDRRFLDAVANRILDIDYETITDYAGNYTKFLDLKAATRQRKEAEIARAEKAVADKKAFVERFKAKASKARQAQSRIKQIERIEIEELPRTSRGAPRFEFEQVRPSGRDVLSVERLGKSYGDHRVLNDVSFEVRRGERLAVIGANGIGKSTLLKLLTENLDPSAGTHTWGYQVQVGYFAQDHRDLLDRPSETPLHFVWDVCPAEKVSYVRGQLGKMLFSGDDVQKPMSALSGGEAARVIFAKLSVMKPNVLVLDEPTNHLDLETIEALTDALLAYPGTLIFVSHDRHLVGRLATRIIELKADGLYDFAGTYDEYVERDGDDHLDIDKVALKARKQKRIRTADKHARAQQRRAVNRLKSLPKRRDELLSAIEKLELEKADVESRYADPNFYQEVSSEELHRMEARQKEIKHKIIELMEQWESVEVELASLGVE